MKYDYCVDKILSGLAKNKSIHDIAKKHKTTDKKIKSQIELGSNTEKEHYTKKGKLGKLVAKTIAKDHVFEDPKYYTHLKKMENEHRKDK